uniref:Coiled-coil domain containing 28A n=1 Tax=Sinocyclocheilus grahami TaxID=75366 RepID=A0A672MWH4_SINGR
MAETRFSAWTPVTNKACNQQLFQERTALILHWFDLWMDRQRKEFICQLLKRCSKTQLKFTRDCLAESVPISRMDFTAVLPRFLSLYIMSFLSPRDICSAAQLCWHWKFLAEQDCLWSPKCIRLGWFLPYSPSDHEYGAWKRHYVACTASLDILTPREAAGVYGTLNESLTASEEQQDRWREHNIRQTIRQKVAEHKRECHGFQHFIYLYLYICMHVYNVYIVFYPGMSITEKTVLKPGVREFWENLCGWVVPASEGGSLNIFAPLAASVAGMDLMMKLSVLTGLNVRAPTGICTGSYQYILSEWSGSGEFPPLVYLHETFLLSWCRQAEWIEEACKHLRKQLGPQLHFMCQEIRGRILGKSEMKTQSCAVTSNTYLIFTLLCMYSNHFPCLCGLSRSVPLGSYKDGLLSDADRRSAVCKELLNSEKTYVRQLQAVATVYYTPLRAALDSNRAIISSVGLITIFCPLLDILETNSVFLKELTEKWEEWGPLQCVGDVCVKFCTKLRVYTNFFNNYPTILRSIDKCREMLPVFRSFLKRHDQTVATRMLSLQELFLTPSARVEVYVTLLQALTLHTPSEHPDYTQLSSALNSLLTYRGFIHKVCLKTKCSYNSVFFRYLVTTQDVALLSCLNGDIAASLRMYEHVSDQGLFLFNDALVLTERSVSNVPFCLAVNTTHTFLSSVALHCLNLTEITNTKCMCHYNFIRQCNSPKRQWICATDREEDKIRLLSALRRAINAAITRN